MIARYATAFQFLTLLPVFKARQFTGRELARSMAAFPLVGATLGAILAGLHWSVGHRLPPLLEGCALVALLALMSGGLHLDGLADTVDGLAGGWTPERSLEIMKDSRVGSLGAAALIMCLMLKVSALAYLPDDIKLKAIFLTPAVARGVVVLLAYKSVYARPAGGLGTPYTEHLDAFTLFAALLFSGGLSLVAGWAGAAAFAVLILYSYLLKFHFHRRLGGITGDVLGFAEETGEIIFLLSLHVIRGFAV